MRRPNRELELWLMLWRLSEMRPRMEAKAKAGDKQAKALVRRIDAFAARLGAPFVRPEPEPPKAT